MRTKDARRIRAGIEGGRKAVDEVLGTGPCVAATVSGGRRDRVLLDAWWRQVKARDLELLRGGCDFQRVPGGWAHMVKRGNIGYAESGKLHALGHLARYADRDRILMWVIVGLFAAWLALIGLAVLFRWDLWDGWSTWWVAAVWAVAGYRMGSGDVRSALRRDI